MHYYHAIVHKEADSAFGVHFPDVPGCFSAADTMEDIIPNAVEALSVWFEDADVPALPSPFEIVQKQAAGDLAEGAFLIMVPRISNDNRVVRANISMERGMLDAVDAAAARRKVTRSAFLADAARAVIEGRL